MEHGVVNAKQLAILEWGTVILLVPMVLLTFVSRFALLPLSALVFLRTWAGQAWFQAEEQEADGECQNFPDPDFIEGNSDSKGETR